LYFWLDQSLLRHISLSTSSDIMFLFMSLSLRMPQKLGGTTRIMPCRCQFQCNACIAKNGYQIARKAASINNENRYHLMASKTRGSLSSKQIETTQLDSSSSTIVLIIEKGIKSNSFVPGSHCLVHKNAVRPLSHSRGPSSPRTFETFNGLSLTFRIYNTGVYITSPIALRLQIFPDWIAKISQRKLRNQRIRNRLLSKNNINLTTQTKNKKTCPTLPQSILSLIPP